MKEKMMRIIVTVMLTLLLCSLTLLAGAASKNDWKNTAGCYVWTESSQYNNGVLNIKPLGDDKYLYELKVMRGSEEEDSAEDFVTAGVFEINEDGDGIAEVDYQNNDTVELRFVLKDKSITAYQDGPLPLDVGVNTDSTRTALMYPRLRPPRCLPACRKSRQACRRMLMIISCSMRRSLWTAGSTS